MKDLTVIFDIDGVIVDSEQLHFDVLYTLAPEQARSFTPYQLIGLSLKETLDHIHVPAAQQPAIIDRVVETYKAKLTAHYLRPNIAALIRRLEQQGIRFGFVSTAPRDVCLANIGLLNLSAEPDLISGDDVACTKPHPDPYLAMLKQLQADRGNTLVIRRYGSGYPFCQRGRHQQDICMAPCTLRPAALPSGYSGH